MKNLIRFAMAAWILPFAALNLTAQTPAENLQSAVETYNAMREYQNGFNAKTITQSNIDDVKSRMDKCVSLLDKVIREGNADQIKTARYFRNNAKYEYGFVLGMKGQNNQAFEVMKEIEKDISAFTYADFPLKYQFFEKNYSISWDNFAPTQAEFYTGLAEISYNLSKYDDAMRLNKKAMAHPNTTGWLKYVAVNKMIDIHSKNNALLTKTEYLDYALQSLQQYDLLDEKNKETVKEFSYPTVKRGMDILIKETPTSPTAQDMARWAEAAPIAAKYEMDDPRTLTLFELCYKNNYKSQTVWDRVASDYAEVAHTQSQMAQPVDMAASKRARFVGLEATNRIAAATYSSDCEALKSIAAKYKYWGQLDKEAAYLKMSKTCLEAQEKANAKAAKAARRGNGNFNLYIGADILPLLNTNPKRDYGVVTDFVFRNSAIEFGYKKMRRNNENIFDLVLSEAPDADKDNVSRWDGFKAHFEPKFFTKNSDNAYIGFRLGYTEKSFDSMTVSVTRDLDLAYSNETFVPGVKQYLGMLTFGGMLLGKGVGLDLKGGIGVNYSTFDPGNPLDRSQYTINNPLLEYRKDHYWTPVLYMGMTMGINFGPGRS